MKLKGMAALLPLLRMPAPGILSQCVTRACIWLQDVPGCPIVWVVWAESFSRDASPSLLLGYALLTSRRESALFLRMATGFGFAQVRFCTNPFSSPSKSLQDIMLLLPSIYWVWTG